MADTSLGTAEQLRDPNYTPALAKAVPLGIQHVLAMFVSNVTPAIIVAGAAGIGFGSDQGALVLVVALGLFGITFGMLGIAWRLMVLLPEEPE